MLYTRHMALMAAGLLFGNIFTGQPRRKSLIRKSLPKAMPAVLGNLRLPEAGNRKGSQEVSSVRCIIWTTEIESILWTVILPSLTISSEAPNSCIFVVVVNSRPLLLSTKLGVYQWFSKHTLTLQHLLVLPALVSKSNVNFRTLCALSVYRPC